VAEAKGQVVLDRPGRGVLPGLVGMHDHLYHIARANLRADGSSEPPLLVPQMTFSSPRLYLAAGVTTIRTTGSVEPYADIDLARAIEEGRLPGPHVEVTAPYLQGSGSPFLQMHPLRDRRCAAPVLRDLPGGRRAGDRRPRARLLREHAARLQGRCRLRPRGS
jgi:hypothetical protein